MMMFPSLSRLFAVSVLLIVFVQHYEPGTYPCAITGGCSAAYSVLRRVVAVYTGPLFQLSRTGGGGGTLNIAQTATGAVNLSSIATFCNTTLPMTNAKLTTGGYACSYHMIYDQSGNANDVTAFGGDTPFEVDAVRNGPRVYHENGRPYLNNAAPMNVNINGTDVSVSVVLNDTAGGTANTTFGLYHCVQGCALDAGSNFGAGVFSHKYFHAFGVDLETDSHQVNYSPGGQGGSLDAQIEPFGQYGDAIGISTYVASTKTVLDDFNGQYVYSSVYPPGLKTTGSAPNEIRIGAGGDGSQFPSIFYEGLIFNKPLNTAERQQVELNTQGYFGITPLPSCGNGPRATIVDIMFPVHVDTYGLRVTAPHYKGPIAIIQDQTTSGYGVFGAVGCDFDTAGAATFLAGHAGKIVEIFNQGISVAGNYAAYGGIAVDTGRMINYSVAAPNYTPNCVGGTRPCLTFNGAIGFFLQQASSLDHTNTPYAFLPVAQVTGADSFQGIMGGGNFYIGAGATNAIGHAQGVNSDGSVTLTASASTWHTWAAVATGGTSMTLYIDGSSATNASLTNTNSTGQMGLGFAPITGGYLTGTIGEFSRILGTAPTSTQVLAIQAAQKTYWGF